MKSIVPIVRLLLLCYLMLALPFQAFAAASMLPRVASLPAAPAASVASVAMHAAQAAELPPCHRQMAMAHMAMAKAKPAQDAHASQHDKGRCDSCAACYVGAAMAPSLPKAPALAPPSTASIPFRAGHLPSVDPVLLERPPSTLLA